MRKKFVKSARRKRLNFDVESRLKVRTLELINLFSSELISVLAVISLRISWDVCQYQMLSNEVLFCVISFEFDFSRSIVEESFLVQLVPIWKFFRESIKKSKIIHFLRKSMLHEDRHQAMTSFSKNTKRLCRMQDRLGFVPRRSLRRRRWYVFLGSCFCFSRTWIDHVNNPIQKFFASHNS